MCTHSSGRTSHGQFYHLFILELLWIHAGLVAIHFIHMKICLEEKASRKERVPKTYDYRSQYDAYKYDMYHANCNIEMEDYTMYRGEYGDQYFHLPSYETLSFFNQPQRPTQVYYYQGQKQEDEDNDNNSFEDLISLVKEHGKESVPFKVGEGVMEANTAPYLSTLKEPILSPIDDIRSKGDEEFFVLSLYENKCSNLLEEAEVTHINLNPPQFSRVVINQVEEDDLVFENEKEQKRKARVGVCKQRLSLCHGKKNFVDVSNCDKLANVASKKSHVKQVRSASSRRKRKRRVRVSKHKHFIGLSKNNISKVFKNVDMTWTRKAEIRHGNSCGKCSIKPP
nr:hypothetical protein [Tanacetum cinerariifolium]